MSKIANMLNMLQILKDKKIHSLASLAEDIEVSERMIRQYKTELEQAGIYLKSYTGKYGGYQLYENSNFLKIENEVKEKMYIIMREAISKKNKIKIKYESVNSGLTERIIHPAELFLYIDKWYIGAFCELRNEIRLFKLDNIKKYEVLNEVYLDKTTIKK
ncbi:MAG: WYL domain-containing protein [Clostridia bacterium]|nr:WYL domain-containing protein [Clostridia bacterium]